MTSTTPDGEWCEPASPLSPLVAAIMTLEPDARGNLLRLLGEVVCSYCGLELTDPDCCRHPAR